VDPLDVFRLAACLKRASAKLRRLAQLAKFGDNLRFPFDVSFTFRIRTAETALSITITIMICVILRVRSRVTEYGSAFFVCAMTIALL
jgi:hypothetical protein